MGRAACEAAGQRVPGATSRWNRGKDLSWEPLRPERVVEVAYDHLQGDRFRHGTTFVRWRPDKRASRLPLRPARGDAGLRALGDLRRDASSVSAAAGSGSRLRVAFIGAGSIVPTHLAALDRLDRTELVGVMSRTAERASATTAGRGTPTYTDMARLLDEQRPDVVYVCTPPYRTPEMCDLLIGGASRSWSRSRWPR